MTWYQEWFGEEYLDLYAYRDDHEARRHVAFFRDEFGPIHGPILDLACGSGRHVIELRRLDYDVRGCDLSFALLRKAISEHRVSGLVVRADMRNLPFLDGTFHGLTNFFTSFGYFETEDDNLAAASEMARVLIPGAPFLLDYLNVKHDLENLVRRETKQIDNRDVEIERWFDNATRTFNKQITIGNRRFLERVRGYDLDELSSIFSRAGFEIRNAYGDFDGTELEEESPRLILTGDRTR